MKPHGTSGVQPITKAITYLAGAADFVYAAGYTTLFTHHDTVNCPLTSCTLMSSDCSAPLATNANLFFKAATSVYELNAKQNLDAGFTNVEFCYKCTGTKFLASGSYST